MEGADFGGGDEEEDDTAGAIGGLITLILFYLVGR